MAYAIEYRGREKWEINPTKNTNSPPHTGMSIENDQMFRIVADTLEEIGLALDDFENLKIHAEQRIRYIFDRIWVDGSWLEYNEFPSRVNKKWEKYGKVTWRDNNPIFN